MNLRHYILACLITLLPLSLLIAQEECAVDQIHKQLLQTNAQYHKDWQTADKHWAGYIDRSKGKRIITASDTLYEIPVVVHVLHRGEQLGHKYNPSDFAIRQMIKYTNDRLRADMTGARDTTNGGTYVPISLVLAQTDPDCNPTNGINRVNTSHIATYNTTGIDLNGFNANDIEVKSQSIWPHTEYLNIWLVWDINGNAAGYANYPWNAGYRHDGMVLDADYVSSSDITIIHELGHLLGLYHTFEGDGTGSTCPLDTNCLTVGDRVCDTEPDKRYPNCTTPYNLCAGKHYGLVRENYMNYSSCTRNHFTPGQRDRMLFHLLSNRMGWVVSKKGDFVSSTGPKSSTCVTTSASTLGLGGPVEVIFNTIHKISNEYTEDSNKAYRDYSCIQRTEVVAGKTYDLTVNGSISSYHMTVYVDYNNDGSFNKNSEFLYDNVGLGTATVTIPKAAVLNTPLRMRVIVDKENFVQLEPCAVLENGQAEDYTITIKEPSSVSDKFAANDLIKIYPNPTKDKLYVNISTAESTVSVYDMMGKKVHGQKYTAGENVIDISSFTAGVYVIKAVSGNNTSTLKFTKQ